MTWPERSKTGDSGSPSGSVRPSGCRRRPSSLFGAPPAGGARRSEGRCGSSVRQGLVAEHLHAGARRGRGRQREVPGLPILREQRLAATQGDRLDGPACGSWRSRRPTTLLSSRRDGWSTALRTCDQRARGRRASSAHSSSTSRSEADPDGGPVRGRTLSHPHRVAECGGVRTERGEGRACEWWSASS